MSLDGYITGLNDEVGNPRGDGFGPLHEWFVTPEGEFFRPSGLAGELFDEMMHAFGAVLVGRRTAEQIDHWGGDHHGSGVLDELQIHQIPVLFGGGRRLFEVLPSRVELEIVRVIDTPEVTHIRYRVCR